MALSKAPLARFAFGQGTTDGMCHLSFSVGNDKPVNLQIPMDDVCRIAENMARVLLAEQHRLRLADDNATGDSANVPA